MAGDRVSWWNDAWKGLRQQVGQFVASVPGSIEDAWDDYAEEAPSRRGRLRRLGERINGGKLPGYDTRSFVGRNVAAPLARGVGRLAALPYVGDRRMYDAYSKAFHIPGEVPFSSLPGHLYSGNWGKALDATMQQPLSLVPAVAGAMYAGASAVPTAIGGAISNAIPNAILFPSTALKAAGATMFPWAVAALKNPAVQRVLGSPVTRAVGKGVKLGGKISTGVLAADSVYPIIQAATTNPLAPIHNPERRFTVTPEMQASADAFNNSPTGRAIQGVGTALHSTVQLPYFRALKRFVVKPFQRAVIDSTGIPFAAGKYVTYDIPRSGKFHIDPMWLGAAKQYAERSAQDTPSGWGRGSFPEKSKRPWSMSDWFEAQSEFGKGLTSGLVQWTGLRDADSAGNAYVPQGNTKVYWPGAIDDVAKRLNSTHRTGRLLSLPGRSTKEPNTVNRISNDKSSER